MNANAKRKDGVSAVLLHINLFFFWGGNFLAWGPYPFLDFFLGPKHGQTLIEQILSWL